MKPKNKKWSELTTTELAAVTREFDDPNYKYVTRKPSKRSLAELHRVQRKAEESRMRISLMLQKDVVEFTDNYAADHGVSFSEVVNSALRQMKKKSA